MSNRTRTRRKKLDPVRSRLNSIAEELGELGGHIVLEPADAETLRRAVAVRDSLKQLYAMQVDQTQALVKMVASQYDIDSPDAAIIDLGQGGDLGLIVWPLSEEQLSDPEPEEKDADEEVAA